MGTCTSVLWRCLLKEWWGTWKGCTRGRDIFRLEKSHSKMGSHWAKRWKAPGTVDIGRNGLAKRGTFNNGTQWETARVCARFPRGQKSMWLLGASVLVEALQGNCCGPLWGKLLWLLQGGIQLARRALRGGKRKIIYFLAPDMGRRGGGWGEERRGRW